MSFGKKITITDIAQLSNTSKTTVSFYLNKKFEKMSEEIGQRIEEVVKETGYKPSALARSMNSKRTNLIGVLIGDITHTFANQIVKGIETVTKEKITKSSLVIVIMIRKMKTITLKTC